MYMKYVLLIISIGLVFTGCASAPIGPIHKVKISDVVFQSSNCNKVQRDLHCTLSLTSEGRDTAFYFTSQGAPTVFDDVNNAYSANLFLINEKEYTNRHINLIADQKVDVDLIFYNFSTKATEIKRMKLAFTNGKRPWTAVLTDIPVSDAKSQVALTNPLMGNQVWIVQTGPYRSLFKFTVSNNGQFDGMSYWTFSAKDVQDRIEGNISSNNIEFIRHLAAPNVGKTQAWKGNIDFTTATVTGSSTGFGGNGTWSAKILNYE